MISPKGLNLEPYKDHSMKPMARMSSPLVTYVFNPSQPFRSLKGTVNPPADSPNPLPAAAGQPMTLHLQPSTPVHLSRECTSICECLSHPGPGVSWRAVEDSYYLEGRGLSRYEKGASLSLGYFSY